jgi:hypothetical protein
VPERLLQLLMLAAAQPADSAGEPGVRRAMIFLLLIAALLGAFLFVVALLTALRRKARRDGRKAAAASPRQPDAWKEAGERMKP